MSNARLNFRGDALKAEQRRVIARNYARLWRYYFRRMVASATGAYAAEKLHDREAIAYHVRNHQAAVKQRRETERLAVAWAAGRLSDRESIANES